MLHQVLTCQIWCRTLLTATRAQDSFLHVHSAAHTAAVNMNRLWSRTRACRRFVPHLRHWLCGSKIDFIRKKFTLHNRECTLLCNTQQHSSFYVTTALFTTTCNESDWQYWMYYEILSVCLSAVHLCTTAFQVKQHLTD